MTRPIDLYAQRNLSGGAVRRKETNVFNKLPLKRGGYIDIMSGYDDTQSLTFIAGAQTQTLINVTVIQGGQILVITDFANQLNDIAAWGYFTWRVLINGNPVPFYGNITNQLGTNNQMRKVGIDMIVEHNQVLTVTCSSAATTPAIYEASVSLKGLYGMPVWESLGDLRE